eukprot:60315_1
MTRMFLQLKQMRNANKCAMEMKNISNKWLQKYPKYKQEAEKLLNECAIKSQYKKDIEIFEKNGSKTQIYMALKSYFALQSYDTIIKNKNKYFELMDPKQNIDEYLHIYYIIGYSFKQTD